MVYFTGKFEAVGYRQVFPPLVGNDNFLPFYMYREEDGVVKYVKVGNSTSDYRLSVTTVSLALSYTVNFVY